MYAETPRSAAWPRYWRCPKSPSRERSPTMQIRSPGNSREISYDRCQLSHDPPQAITCVECGDRTKWLLPLASRTRRSSANSLIFAINIH